jgi:DNA repair protein RecN (Recombination protein N)
MALSLVELRVRNLGVIDDVAVSLGPGMTALTGETGAGKTLLVEALSLLLGGRADQTVVRAGADEAMVEGRFLIPAGTGHPSDGDDRSAGKTDGGGPDEVGLNGWGPDEIVLARAVVRGGRSKAWIDGRMATVGALAELAGGLIELHGQHQHQSLTRAEAQRRALDAFGQIELTGLEAAQRRLRLLTDESAAIGGDVRQRAREVDLLNYQVDEIAAAGIEDLDEDGRLEVEEDRLAAATAHRQAAAAALAAISGSDDSSALDRLGDASGSVAGRAPLAPMEARIRSSMADLADLATELRTVVETWDDDPERLEEIRNRRKMFHELERKYGNNLEEVLAHASDARERLGVIEREELRASALDGEIRSARDALEQAESDVASARRETAPRLAGQIELTLKNLAMPSARFSISVEGAGPADQVSFLLGANPGEPLQPLAKVASGGELARTMLAVRLAITDSPGVMAFDEVDAGVGGAAATSVGSALAGLGRHAQVLVVTHLAQVAALADHQIEVRKSEGDGRTRSEVVALDAEGRVVEISRMLSGRPDSSSARRHARELLEGSPARGTR